MSTRANIGSGERVGRIIVGVALVVSAIGVVGSGAALWGWVGALLALAAGAALVFTGARGHCPLYRRFGHVPRSQPTAAAERAGTGAATGASISQPRVSGATGGGPMRSSIAPVYERASGVGGSRPGQSSQDTELVVAECEAVLSGRYAEHLEDRQRRVPGWAWLNLLAHGTAEDLQSANGRGGPAATQRWRDARAYLAGEVLGAVAPGGATLGNLQRDVLVPLELRLASPERTSVPTPGELVSCLLAALDAYRRAQHHRSPDRPTRGTDR